MATTIDLTRKFATNAESIPALLLRYFGGNPYYAMARTIAGEVTFQPVKHALTEDIIQDHLNGKIVLGAYQLLQDNMVHWLGWDVDSNNRDTARTYAHKVLARLKDIPHAVEFSGSKGYHILVFLSEPMPAERAKLIVEHVRGDLPKTGASHIEVFPKQAVLNKATPMGNLLKMPLGLHPRSHERSRFVDPNNGFETGQDLEPIQFLTNTVKPEELEVLLQDTTDPRKQIVELLVPYWSEGDRHNVALYLSGYLAHLGWGLEAVRSVITGICQATGDPDEANRLTAVQDTFISIEQGKSVKGFSGLNDILPGTVLKGLIEQATQAVTPGLVRRIDSIRLSKAAMFEKIRITVSTIWSDLQEIGEVIRSPRDEAYWYNKETHLLVPLLSERFLAVLYHNYGINSAEAFGAQVIRGLRNQATHEARIVTLRNRTVWTGDKLLVNLGTEEVYQLDGHDIITVFNGECGYMFRTDLYSEHRIIPDFSSHADVWNHLVQDISFSKSNDVPATPEEQAELLKAWILAFFFQELMPTKPLLLAMGAPGSGKTTAMRRIMRLLDSPDSDVLEIVSDKPDSFRATLELHRMVVLDNLENSSNVRWLVDMLNRLATGMNIELRRLYSNNEVYLLRPDVFVAMTAVTMPFAEDTLFSRILPLEMQQLQNPQPEYRLQRILQSNMNGLWADMLVKLNRIVGSLVKNSQEEPPIASRLADFTVFCKRIEKSGVVNGPMLIRGLRSLVDRQKIALLGVSPFIYTLEDWISLQPAEADKFHTMYELYGILEPIAHSKKIVWPWKDAVSMGRHVLTLQGQLEKLYQADIRLLDNRDMFQVRFRQTTI